MSHEDVATVWSVLAGRQDIDHVLRELIGTHALNVSLARHNTQKLRDAFISHLATLRVVFDLQRIYLQSSPRSEQSILSALSCDLVFSAVLHLLDVIVTSTTSCSDLATERSYNDLTAHTTLSGLRVLLLLQKKSLSAGESNLLNSRFEEIYERGHWYGPRYILILRLCRQVIQALAAPKLEEILNGSAFYAVGLPDFFAGLYLFQVNEKSILDASRKVGTVDLLSQNWFRDCLVLYDLFWSTTAALIQICMIRQESPGATLQRSPQSEVIEPDNFQLVLSTRYQLQKQTFLASEIAEDTRTIQQLQTLLLQDMSSACAEEVCSCFQPYANLTQKVRLQHNMRLPSVQSPDKACPGTPFESEASNALRRLRGFMEKRLLLSARPQNTIARLRLAGYDTASTADSHIETSGFKRAATLPNNKIPRKELSPSKPLFPLPQTSANTLHNISDPISNNTYANKHSSMNDPTPIPALPDTKAVIPQRNPSNTSSYSNTTNPETTAGSEVFSYRSPPLSSVDEEPPPRFQEIDKNNFPEVHYGASKGFPHNEKLPFVAATECFPEVYIPSTQEKLLDLERSQSWQPDRDNHPEVAPSRSLTVTAPSIFSQESDASSFIFQPQTPSAKPKRWNGLFGASRSQLSFSPPSFTFFASGSSLLIWNEVGAGFYDFHDSESIQFRRVNASSVCAAAGGQKRCAVVVKGVSEYRLEVYEGQCDVPLREWKLENLPYAMALSLSDNHVAAKFSRTVKIYQVDNGGMFRHDLPPAKSRSGRGNHLVTFSTDSLSFVASTRYEPEKVVTYWSECTTSHKATVVESTAPTGFPGDNGLSSIVCSNTQTRAAFMATFTEKGLPNFLSLKPPKLAVRPIRDPKGRIGTRIHHTALSPSGTSLVLVNQRNDVYWVDDCWTGISEPRRVGSVKRSIGVTKDVELGMPNDDEVHLFWIEKGKGMLVTMGKGGGKTKPVELVVNLEMLVA